MAYDPGFVQKTVPTRTLFPRYKSILAPSGILIFILVGGILRNLNSIMCAYCPVGILYRITVRHMCTCDIKLSCIVSTGTSGAVIYQLFIHHIRTRMYTLYHTYTRSIRKDVQRCVFLDTDFLIDWGDLGCHIKSCSTLGKIEVWFWDDPRSILKRI